MKIVYFIGIIQKKNIYDIKGVNFAYGDIKPWTKFPIFQWDNENIWHKIAKKVLVNQIN